MTILAEFSGGPKDGDVQEWPEAYPIIDVLPPSVGKRIIAIMKGHEHVPEAPPNARDLAHRYVLERETEPGRFRYVSIGPMVDTLHIYPGEDPEA